MMFAVLGYQHTNAEVLDALATARAHLEVGGLFAFDVWYGPAVLSERPSERVKVIETGDQRIIRVASGSLDEPNHLCTVDYRLWTLEGDQLVGEVTESHAMRFFFPLELELLPRTCRVLTVSGSARFPTSMPSQMRRPGTSSRLRAPVNRSSKPSRVGSRVHQAIYSLGLCISGCSLTPG